MEFHLIIWAIALELVVIWLNLTYLETIFKNYFFVYFKEYKSSLKYFSNSKHLSKTFNKKQCFKNLF